MRGKQRHQGNLLPVENYDYLGSQSTERPGGGGKVPLAFDFTRGYIAAELMNARPMEETENRLVHELVAYLREEGVEVKGARGIEGMNPPPSIANDGYGSARPRRADVVGFDPQKRRVVFGLVRPGRKSLDSEDALEEYNVFLDHNSGAGERASALYVIMPQDLLNEFTSIVTHYLHREYWHRVVAVGSTGGSRQSSHV
ncbi:MAG TPA: hypothetical protein VF514_02590 [Bacteroidota bacterium]